MISPIEGDGAPRIGESATPANWALRDVVIGIAVLLVFRSLSLVGREPVAWVPIWLLLGVATIVPQAFFLAYPLMLARRRRIAGMFRLPTAEKSLLEGAIAVPVVIGLLVVLITTTWLISLVWPRVTLTSEVIQRAADAPTVSFVIFIVAVATLVAPVCEEVFFRGFLQSALRSRIPVFAAALVQSSIFAALHTFGVVHGVAVFFLGLVLTFVFEWRKTLLAPILVHAGNNLFASLGFVALVIINATSPALGVMGHDHPQGYQVDNVVPGAAAAKAGIAEGDIITNLDGEAMTDSRQLVSALRLHRVGDTVTVGILRGGESIEIKVVLEKRPASR